MKKYLELFFTMFKIGLFTFGGGYAMLSLLENEFVSKKKWMDSAEFLDMVAIAESTPGPIAINAATYLGYRTGKFLGALVCTVAVCIPSFVIIYLISLFFNQFLEVAWVAAAFKGIRVCVIFLILSAGIKMLMQLPKTLFHIVVLCSTLLCMTLLSAFAVDFSSVFYILIGAALGLSVYLVGIFRRREKHKGEKK